ncbi:hypothetical protein FB45DRAFT_888248 [Roridomyces roridus]|uniref:Uncharacterized protein n=1 Tax=Roridomyces roridus TaxID=1738132 RepID=A0AAD7G1E3_9AGAR|nr:hypothetical protein FB45DRAFT_888248 [Roridomyces roridus]
MNPNLIGSIEIVSLLSVILLGMSVVQVYVYYINFPHDSRVVRSLIALLTLLTFLHACGTCYSLYIITIKHYGLFPPIPFQLLKTAILGCFIHPIVQAIFAARIYQLSTQEGQARFRVIAAVCWSLAGFIFGCTVLLSMQVMRFIGSVDDFAVEWAWLVESLLGTTAVLDIIVTAVMGCGMQRGEMNAIDLLVSWTGQTGLITSISAIAVLIWFTFNKTDHIWLSLLILTTGCTSVSFASTFTN